MGNEKGEPLRRVSLYEILADPTAFLSRPSEWKAKKKTLLAPERDQRVLVSAQAAFLPIPKGGNAEFNPVIFNYQSVSGDPAVLTILATRVGTSMTIIDNKRDSYSNGGAWGQRLFHNQDGRRANLTGQRKSDWESSTRQTSKGPKGESTHGTLNMLLLIQVPLKQKTPQAGWGDEGFTTNSANSVDSAMPSSSNVEAAVLSFGKTEGPFTEIDNLSIERDDRFPVRVTVQFYKATSNGVVTEDETRQIREEIDFVYKHGDAVGSLVTGGKTGRVTEYYGMKIQPFGWWKNFWSRFEKDHGISRTKAKARLDKLLGKSYEKSPVSDLFLRTILSDV